MKGLYLRRADYSDIDLLYLWANDPLVRKNSFQSDFIPLDAHIKWFNNMMIDNSILQFIMMNDSIPVGQVRLNLNGEDAYIGYSIAKEYRGKGYGREIIQLITKTVSLQHPEIKRLIAWIKPDNKASLCLFETEDYHHLYDCYVKEITH